MFIDFSWLCEISTRYIYFDPGWKHHRSTIFHNHSVDFSCLSPSKEARATQDVSDMIRQPPCFEGMRWLQSTQQKRCTRKSLVLTDINGYESAIQMTFHGIPCKKMMSFMWSLKLDRPVTWRLRKKKFFLRHCVVQAATRHSQNPFKYYGWSNTMGFPA